VSPLATLVPDLSTGLTAAAAGLLLALATGAGAGVLRGRGVRVAYTRKVFHFGIFTGAGAVHACGGLPATNAYGAVVAAWVLLAVVRGDGDPLYEALRQAPFVSEFNKIGQESVDGRDWITLEIKSDGNGISEQLFRLVVEKGWSLRELRTEKMSLEEVFARLTTS